MLSFPSAVVYFTNAEPFLFEEHVLAQYNVVDNEGALPAVSINVGELLKRCG